MVDGTEPEPAAAPSTPLTPGPLSSGHDFVSLVDLASGMARHVDVGLHPTAIAVKGGKAYVANAMSDSVSEVDIKEARVTRTILLRWGDLRIFGAMPRYLR